MAASPRRRGRSRSRQLNPFAIAQNQRGRHQSLFQRGERRRRPAFIQSETRICQGRSARAVLFCRQRRWDRRQPIVSGLQRSTVQPPLISPSATHHLLHHWPASWQPSLFQSRLGFFITAPLPSADHRLPESTGGVQSCPRPQTLHRNRRRRHGRRGPKAIFGPAKTDSSQDCGIPLEKHRRFHQTRSVFLLTSPLRCLSEDRFRLRPRSRHGRSAQNLAVTTLLRPCVAVSNDTAIRCCLCAPVR